MDKRRTPPEIYNAYMAVFDSPAGEIVLEDLKRANFFYNSLFSQVPGETILREGMRNAVLRILTILDSHPDQFKTDTGVSQKEG